MLPPVITANVLDDLSKSNSVKLLAENQEDLAFKLRNLIANFCDEHFVKYLKEAKLESSAKSGTSTIPEETTTTPAAVTIDADKPLNGANNKETVNTNDEQMDSVSLSPPNSSLKENCESVTISDVLVGKEPDLNLTSSSSLTPPRSSYSSTSSSTSSSCSSASPSSDIATTDETKVATTENNVNMEEPSVDESHKSVSNDINDVIDKLEIIDCATKSIKQISTSAEHNLHHRLNEEVTTASSGLEKLWLQLLIGADKLEIFGSIHVRSNNVRLFSCLIDEQLNIENAGNSFSSASSCVSTTDSSSCSLSSKLLAKNNGHHKLFRNANNIFYSAKSGDVRNSNSFYRRKRQEARYTRRPSHAVVGQQKKSKNEMCNEICCSAHMDDYYDVEEDFNHTIYRQHIANKLKRQAKRAARANSQPTKPVEVVESQPDQTTLEKPAHHEDEEADKGSEQHILYPMKKFKAYHSYCNNKRKIIEQQQQQQAEQEEGEKQQVSGGQEEQAITSLSNLATVAAAAMRLNSSTVATAVASPVATSPVTTKKSRKSSITSSIKQLPMKHVENETEIELDEEENEEDELMHNNSLIMESQPTNPKQINEYVSYLYDEVGDEEDFDDNSSLISDGASSFTTTSSTYRLNNIKKSKSMPEPAQQQPKQKGEQHSHRRQHSTHSRCSSILSGDAGISSRSISINGDCVSMSRSPSFKKTNGVSGNVKTITANGGNNRSVSPATSLASSSFDYDDEQVYQSYCSSSSFKSDFEDDFGHQEAGIDEEFEAHKKKTANNYQHHHHHHHRKLNKTKKINDENNKPVVEEELGADELDAANKMDQSDKFNRGSNATSRHYHRRKHHLIEADLQHAKQADQDDVVQFMAHKQFKIEKDSMSQQTIVPQQAQLMQHAIKSSLAQFQQFPKLIGVQQQQQELQQQQQQQELSKQREDDYLVRKYKYNRRFAPYNANSTANSNNATNGSQQNFNNSNAMSDNMSQLENTSTNLYLLASSRHHHRLNHSSNEGMNGEANANGANISIDRLSPISDPDMEAGNQKPGSGGEKLHHHQGHHIENNSSNDNILNRINNLSPSSSSSSSSSSKHLQQQQQQQQQQQANSNASQLSQMFHYSSLQQQQQQSQHNSNGNSAAAVLATAAAAAAAAGSPHSLHHLSMPNSHHSHHHHHAQSVAALLADMQHQQQQNNSQDVAKVLAATLNPHHTLGQHNHHAQQIINRFSSNPSQSELMAAVLAQQQQQQQQHRSLLDSHLNGSGGASYASALNANGQLYSRYSSHLNAAVAAAAAAAASSAAAAAAAHSQSSSSNRRAHSVESDATTPSPPATTPANINGASSNSNGQLSGSSSLSSSSSSSSSTTSENYANSKYNMHERGQEMCKKERSSSVMSSSNDPTNANGNEKVRLVAGFDVFISTNDLNACNDDRGSATRLLRNLMDVFFDKSTLAKSSINGTGRITNTLDKHVISALFAYVKNRYQDVPHSQLTRAATDKCVQTRRNFRKKIKAAQSYFGMFPSIMIQRPPPQLQQGSE